MTGHAPPAVEIRGLTKRFLNTRALEHVDLTIDRGEIHALVGENGAGKSTLIKILAGIYQADEGEIRIDGQIIANAHADAVPIAFVHQDLGLVDELSIGENVALVAGFPRVAGFISWRGVRDQARKIYAMMGVDFARSPGAGRHAGGLEQSHSRHCAGALARSAHRCPG